MGLRETAAHEVWRSNLQRGTAAATELGGDRHVHQLKALCLIFDHHENIYCATQLCSCRDGLIVQICQLSLDCPQLQTLYLQVVCERESASVSGTVGNQSPLGFF
ncbi:hypothetical protein QE433_005367 [Agrobacterium tumefaciens]|nr:hypothetical protein [Agrobacterium tumefaciens]